MPDPCMVILSIATSGAKNLPPVATRRFLAAEVRMLGMTNLPTAKFHL